MEHYCKRCETTREFRLKQESNTESIYECYSCGAEWKQKTFVGHIKDWAGVATMIGIAIITGGNPPPSGGS